MPFPVVGESLLTELDHVRLTRLQAAQVSPSLGGLLAAADLVPSRLVPADVVTMYSQVRVRDPQTAQVHTCALCYPADAEPESGFISVLSPLGLALIGRRVGDAVACHMPGGGERRYVIEALLFQPEASGDYTT